ncbi:MAG: helix-turn-helix domain-containing protein [candidate division NC10 bacterium]|nr:helix-turn-helix domain-containing protein [candidate division NC10 bacterium]
MTLTPEEGRKLHVLTLLEGKRISLSQAAEALGVTPRQVRRLRVGLRREGPAGVGAQEKMRQSPQPRRSQTASACAASPTHECHVWIAGGVAEG